MGCRNRATRRFLTVRARICRSIRAILAVKLFLLLDRSMYGNRADINRSKQETSRIDISHPISGAPTEAQYALEPDVFNHWSVVSHTAFNSSRLIHCAAPSQYVARGRDRQQGELHS